MKTKTHKGPGITDAQELLDNCAREPIHRPGRIQSHGLLLITDPEGEKVLCASENVPDLLGLEIDFILGASLPSISTSAIPDLGRRLKEFIAQGGAPELRSALPLELELGNGRSLNVFAVRGADGHRILEFEHTSTAQLSDVHAHLLSAFSNFRRPQLDIARVLDHAAREVKEAIGFGRVMIYKFHQDWHGEVVAEACDTLMESFMGLHFPASDIPAQARDLYTRNLTRLIADVHAPTIALHTLKGHEELAGTDLSNVETRAVSPVHIQYLKNMGVGASFSISIMSQGRLWGLIACHNTTAATISPSVRTTCLLIGQLLAVSLEADQERDTNQVNAQAEQALRDLANEMHGDKDVDVVLAANAGTLLQLFNADGLWSNIGAKVTSAGIAPGDGPLIAMIAAMDHEAAGSVIGITCLADVLYAEDNHHAGFAGFLGIRLHPSTHEFLFFMRREKIHNVIWAGAPKKNDERFEQNGWVSLGPRRSFEKWEEQVQGTSEKWTPLDLSMGRRSRTIILDALDQRSALIRDLNEKLREAYEEMEAFSYTISHDLRVPLSSIANYAEMIIEELGITPTDEVRQMVVGISRGTTRMSRLIDHVMEHARLGKIEVRRQRVPIQGLIHEIHGDLEMKYKGHKPQHRLLIGDTPAVMGDPVMVGQVFGNLISNAFKYTQHVEEPTIRVNGNETNAYTAYTISDNGIGIDMRHKDRVFQLFRRSDNADNYEGNGVGLAIVKRIVDRHGGQISFNSVLGSGTSFEVSFPKG